ncbi:hypothetical protein BNJ_00336 [Kaumoebavirus]|uniref:hypothetical protein n=1 Tax=Kaumoebavirus TaxID=1859492 RepID=UPI0009C2E9EE|nr:hypothetical protein BNJ_00336 [Kaumoebavirus]ARA72156.1 hypothetical protein BNJ_00336 [Kaumoebavirus]
MSRLEELPRTRIAGALEYVRGERPLRFVREGRNRLIIWADIRKCLGLREKRPEEYGLRRTFDYTTRYLTGFNSLSPLVIVVREKFLGMLRRRAKFERRQRELELELLRQRIEISDETSDSDSE